MKYSTLSLAFPPDKILPVTLRHTGNTHLNYWNFYTMIKWHFMD